MEKQKHWAREAKCYCKMAVFILEDSTKLSGVLRPTQWKRHSGWREHRKDGEIRDNGASEMMGRWTCPAYRAPEANKRADSERGRMIFQRVKRLTLTESRSLYESIYISKYCDKVPVSGAIK